MRQNQQKPHKKRSRDCHDSLRAQLAALFAPIVGRAPVLAPVADPEPAPYVAPPLHPEQIHRNAIARLLGVPSRYVKFAMAQGRLPSYAILFHDIRYGSHSRDDAMTVLRQIAPEACAEWLDHVEDHQLWTSLLLCYDPEGTRRDTNIRLLRAALAWTTQRDAANAAPGPADAGLALTPEGGAMPPRL